MSTFKFSYITKPERLTLEDKMGYVGVIRKSNTTAPLILK